MVTAIGDGRGGIAEDVVSLFDKDCRTIDDDEHSGWNSVENIGSTIHTGAGGVVFSAESSKIAHKVEAFAKSVKIFNISQSVDLSLHVP